MKPKLVERRVLDTDEAMAWCRANKPKPGYGVNADTGKEWGWINPDGKVRRSAVQAVLDNYWKETAAPKPRKKKRESPPALPPAPAAPATSVPDVSRSVPSSPSLAPRIVVTTRTPSPPKPHRHPVLAVILASFATVLLAAGLILNWRFYVTLDTKDAVNAVDLAVGAVILDAIASAMPTATVALWGMRRYLLAPVAFLVFVGGISMTVVAAAGFVASNLGDSFAARQDIIEQRGALGDAIASLKLQLDANKEKRAAKDIDASIILAQAAVPPDIWGPHRSKQCTDATLPDSRLACQGLIDLRAALTAAQSRDDLRHQLADLQGKLFALPTVASADAGAELLQRFTTVDAAWFSIARQLGLVVAFSVGASLVYAFAFALWGPRLARP